VSLACDKMRLVVVSNAEALAAMLARLSALFL